MLWWDRSASPSSSILQNSAEEKKTTQKTPKTPQNKALPAPKGGAAPQNPPQPLLLTFPDVSRSLEHEAVAAAQAALRGAEGFWGALGAPPASPGDGVDGAEGGDHRTPIGAGGILGGGGNAGGGEWGQDYGDGLKWPQTMAAPKRWRPPNDGGPQTMAAPKRWGHRTWG